MREVFNFLKEAAVYYIATCEGDQPRVRPFSSLLLFEEKLYIQTGKIKDVAKQIFSNPKVEICAFKDGKWIRITGKLIEDNRREARVAMLEAFPELKKMYDPDEGNTVVFYLSDAVATFSSFAGTPKAVTF